MNRLGLDPTFPVLYCGISSMKCSACEFEFVYVEPEETQHAYVVMTGHFEEAHPDLRAYDTPVTCTRY